VRVNASGITDKAFTEALVNEASHLEQLTDAKDAELRAMVIAAI
jgi:hypothetical protein